MTLSKTLTTAIISASACALLPAMAATEFDPVEKTMEVSIKGYDLTNAKDAAEVFNMINVASKRACKHYGLRTSLRERIQERTCRAEAIVNAVASIDAPELTAIMNKTLEN